MYRKNYLINQRVKIFLVTEQRVLQPYQCRGDVQSWHDDGKLTSVANSLFEKLTSNAVKITYRAAKTLVTKQQRWKPWKSELCSGVNFYTFVKIERISSVETKHKNLLFLISRYRGKW